MTTANTLFIISRVILLITHFTLQQLTVHRVFTASILSSTQPQLFAGKARSTLSSHSGKIRHLVSYVASRCGSKYELNYLKLLKVPVSYGIAAAINYFTLIGKVTNQISQN